MSETRATRLLLPNHVTACLFDLDGVLVESTGLHNAAWQAALTEFLDRWAHHAGRRFASYDPARDYRDHLDGKPRVEGVRAFLASRGIELPLGDPDDPPDTASAHGLANRKHALSTETIRGHGVRAYPESVRFLHAAKAAGMPVGLVTSSGNSDPLLRSAGLAGMFDILVDGRVAAARGLAGKPRPDTYLAGAALLGADPRHTAIFEDAEVGVTAGRAGGFGYVVGVDRLGNARALRELGADIVVNELSELLAAVDVG